MKILLLILACLFHQGLKAQFYTIRPIERPTFRILKNRTSATDSVLTDSSTYKATTSPIVPASSEGSLIGFSLPLDRPLVVNSKYGYHIDPFTKKQKFHYGIDLKSQSNLVLSMLGGKVKKTGFERKGLGNYVTLVYGDFEVTYGHLSSILVSVKDIVHPGTPIGVSGSTGRSTGDHLHLSLKRKGKKVDPLPFLLFVQKRSFQQVETDNT